MNTSFNTAWSLFFYAGVPGIITAYLLWKCKKAKESTKISSRLSMAETDLFNHKQQMEEFINTFSDKSYVNAPEWKRLSDQYTEKKTILKTLREKKFKTPFY